jgi:hypothetical protein
MLKQTSESDKTCRNQPHSYSELHRYDLQRHLKPTVAAINPAKTVHNFANGTQEVDFGATMTEMERIFAQFFEIDGLTSRELMPYPHDSYHKPARWVDYDHLSVQDRLEQLEIPTQIKELFEAYIGLFGCGHPRDIGFTEALRWYALSGHSMARVYELSSVYKLGNGGMTSFAKAILADFRGDCLFNTTIKGIIQDTSGLHLTTTTGKDIHAKVIVSTIPL